MEALSKTPAPSRRSTHWSPLLIANQLALAPCQMHWCTVHVSNHATSDVWNRLRPQWLKPIGSAILEAPHDHSECLKLARLSLPDVDLT